MKNRFNKPFLPVSHLIEVFYQHGMDFGNRKNAFRLLSSVGTYRFMAYALAFVDPKEPSMFVKGTKFEDVFSIFEFDRNLKSILFHYLGRLEVALSTQIIDYFSIGKHSTLWYTDPKNFSDEHDHKRFLEGIEHDLKVSTEEYIQQFRAKYSDKFPPCWIALQIVSFGTLLKLYSNFNDRRLRTQVAKRFGCDSTERFISWMNTLVYLRNICSHHARLWNRVLKKRPEAFNFGNKNVRWTQDDVSKLYYTVCIMGYMLNRIQPGNRFKKELKILFSEYPYIDSIKTKYLGFPDNWHKGNFPF